VKKIVLAVLLGLLAVTSISTSIGCDNSSKTAPSGKK
jgi:hypothetical protein